MRKITIIGGGVAGLSLGIALRQQSVPVRLIESKPYPHHKVCGEVISGRGAEVLAQLGLEPFKLGVRIQSISFHCRNRNTESKPLPQVAVAIPRVDLDFALMERFVNLGGELDCPCRFQSSQWEDGFVRATGRRVAKHGKYKWYGLKGHIQDVELLSDLELHFVADGYIGLCKIGSRGANVCGLFRRNGGPGGPRDLVEHLDREPAIRTRLAAGCWQQDSMVAVAGLPIENDEPVERGTLAIGDAFSMIPPFTGNGMSLGLESALLAAVHLVRYASERCSWEQTCNAYQVDARRMFSNRIRLARGIQKLLVSLPLRWILSTGIEMTPVWRIVFQATR